MISKYIKKLILQVLSENMTNKEFHKILEKLVSTHLENNWDKYVRTVIEVAERHGLKLVR